VDKFEEAINKARSFAPDFLEVSIFYSALILFVVKVTLNNVVSFL